MLKLCTSINEVQVKMKSHYTRVGEGTADPHLAVSLQVITGELRGCKLYTCRYAVLNHR